MIDERLVIPDRFKREKVEEVVEKSKFSPEVEMKRRAHKIAKWCADALERECKRERARRKAKR